MAEERASPHGPFRYLQNPSGPRRQVSREESLPPGFLAFAPRARRRIRRPPARRRPPIEEVSIKPDHWARRSNHKLAAPPNRHDRNERLGGQFCRPSKFPLSHAITLGRSPTAQRPSAPISRRCQHSTAADRNAERSPAFDRIGLRRTPSLDGFFRRSGIGLGP